VSSVAPHRDGSPAFVETPRGHAVVAPGLGDEVTLTVDVPHAAGLTRPRLCLIDPCRSSP
jgi:hypothetical protein